MLTLTAPANRLALARLLVSINLVSEAPSNTSIDSSYIYIKIFLCIKENKQQIITRRSF